VWALCQTVSTWDTGRLFPIATLTANPTPWTQNGATALTWLAASSEMRSLPTGMSTQGQPRMPKSRSMTSLRTDQASGSPTTSTCSCSHTHTRLEPGCTPTRGARRRATTLPPPRKSTNSSTITTISWCWWRRAMTARISTPLGRQRQPRTSWRSELGKTPRRHTWHTILQTLKGRASTTWLISRLVGRPGMAGSNRMWCALETQSDLHTRMGTLPATNAMLLE